MSKSLGNFFTVREIAEKYDLQVLRFFMLNAHYRSPLNFSADLMESSRSAMRSLSTVADEPLVKNKMAKSAAATKAMMATGFHIVAFDLLSSSILSSKR